MMKRFIPFFLALGLVGCLVGSAFATQPSPSVQPDDASGGGDTVDTPVNPLGEYVGSTVYALNPITPSNTTGLKSVLLGILGNYDAIVVEHAYQSGNGYTNYLREVQPDYTWIASAVLLVVVIFCLFRLGGGLICKQ